MWSRWTGTISRPSLWDHENLQKVKFVLKLVKVSQVKRKSGNPRQRTVYIVSEVRENMELLQKLSTWAKSWIFFLQKNFLVLQI